MVNTLNTPWDRFVVSTTFTTFPEVSRVLCPLILQKILFANSASSNPIIFSVI